MANPMLEPLEPYRPDPLHPDDESYDWDYEEDHVERRPMQILWGRVALLSGIVLVAFFLGRMTGGSGGIPASDLKEARDQVGALEEENAALATEVAALQQQNAELQDQIAAPPADTTDTTASEGDANTITGQRYTVKSGDTLTSIAEKFYGDSTLDDFLAEMNNISDPTALSVGMELIIPDNPPEQ